MATNAQRIAALERIADLENEIREFRLDTLLQVAGIAFSAGRDSITKPGSRAARTGRPRHLSVVVPVLDEGSR